MCVDRYVYSLSVTICSLACRHRMGCLKTGHVPNAHQSTTVIDGTVEHQNLVTPHFTENQFYRYSVEAPTGRKGTPRLVGHYPIQVKPGHLYKWSSIEFRSGQTVVTGVQDKSIPVTYLNIPKHTITRRPNLYILLQLK